MVNLTLGFLFNGFRNGWRTPWLRKAPNWVLFTLLAGAQVCFWGESEAQVLQLLGDVAPIPQVSADANSSMVLRACTDKVEAELALSEVHGRFVTTISMNNWSVLMLVDTGAGHTAISTRFAELLALPQEQRKLVRVTGIGGRSTVQHPIVLRSLKFGPLELENYDVNAASIVRPEQEADPASPIGLIGTDLLSRYDVEFDFPNHKMTLHTLTECEDHFVPKWTGTYQSFHPVRTEQNTFIIPVELNGYPIRTLVDTGSNTSSVTREAATRVSGVDSAAIDQEPTNSLVGSNGVVVAGHRHHFNTMRIGNATFKNAPILVQESSLNNLDMLLGMDYLRWRKVWISYKTNQIFMQYSPDKSKFSPSVP